MKNYTTLQQGATLTVSGLPEHAEGHVHVKFDANNLSLMGSINEARILSDFLNDPEYFLKVSGSAPAPESAAAATKFRLEHP
jgi:hypothetical protein